jgi:hypothetical protein
MHDDKSMEIDRLSLNAHCVSHCDARMGNPLATRARHGLIHMLNAGKGRVITTLIQRF